MSDPRIQKLAQVLVQYSLELRKGETLFIRTSPLAEALNQAVYKEAILVGAYVDIQSQVQGAQEIFYKHASDDQIDYVSPITRFVVEKYRAILVIDGEYNTHELTAVDPARQARNRAARAEISNLMNRRTANKELNWCYTVYPTHASAQDAEMSLTDYEEFVFEACLLNLDDPVAAWTAEGERQKKLIQNLAGHNKVSLQGKDVDLQLSIQGRSFEEACGKHNFPDGEIYTSPVEDSTNGWIRFSYPLIFDGKEVQDVELWFEHGKVVKEQASKGQELLTQSLNIDGGARYLGELGIGTNYAIQRFTKNMLFDEKIGGTIHLAVGMGFPEVGGKNESGLHWDMLCDMSESEIRVDGDLFYKDGKIVGLLP